MAITDTMIIPSYWYGDHSKEEKPIKHYDLLYVENGRILTALEYYADLSMVLSAEMALKKRMMEHPPHSEEVKIEFPFYLECGAEIDYKDGMFSYDGDKFDSLPEALDYAVKEWTEDVLYQTYEEYYKWFYQLPKEVVNEYRSGFYKVSHHVDDLSEWVGGEGPDGFANYQSVFNDIYAQTAALRKSLKRADERNGQFNLNCDVAKILTEEVKDRQFSFDDVQKIIEFIKSESNEETVKELGQHLGLERFFDED